MDVAEGQVAPHVADVVAVAGEELADHALGLAAVGAFEVAVFEQGHRGVIGTADVVVRRVDLDREVEDVLGGPADLAGSDGVGEPLDDPR